ncbi:hypothetical protein LOK49_LG10G02341 [Camellia lanceoleosa]|uniref:Uncharacterized protein n=1 Tax=Camellia lanceoleosa TaxID=1840588 RepID=A0ACC0G886_9ERIC|nr:hypothetical protein LOK49_LG10G02341 [Camellia lanceoleosa]
MNLDSIEQIFRNRKNYTRPRTNQLMEEDDVPDVLLLLLDEAAPDLFGSRVCMGSTCRVNVGTTASRRRSTLKWRPPETKAIGGGRLGFGLGR